MQWSTDIRQGKRGTVGSSLHRENLGELPNGPRGWNPPKEGAAFRDGLWVGTLVPGGACAHRCCADLASALATLPSEVSL